MHDKCKDIYPKLTQLNPLLKKMIPISGTADKKKIIRKKKFEGQSFSFIDIVNTEWHGCSFIDCEFDSAVFRRNVFINCRFVRVIFSGCLFTDCQLAVNSGKKAGIFENVQFENCQLTRTDFNFPVIKDCSFTNNIYTEMDFDGSRLYNTRFVGEMDTVEFRGYSVLATTDKWGIFKSVDPRKFKNPMENVDFTQARLRYVGFSHGINLSNCRFPDDGNSFLIRSPRACFTKVKAIIEHGWNPADKKRALHLIDTFLFTKNHESMPVIYFYKRPVEESLKEFDEKLFALVKQVNDETVSA
jgi:uncharacterized protein YjbI with pentapeptide repeats